MLRSAKGILALVDPATPVPVADSTLDPAVENILAQAAVCTPALAVA
jgi:hypothetical protein